MEDDEDDHLLVAATLADIPEQPSTLIWHATYQPGLDAATGGGFDVILVDHGLGARTGIDFLAAVKHAGCKTPVILLTGASSRDLDVKAMNAGAADFIGKHDLRPDLLERSIRYAIDRAAQQAKVAALNQRLVKEQTRLLRAERLTSVGVVTASITHVLGNPLGDVVRRIDGLRERIERESELARDLQQLEGGLLQVRTTLERLVEYAQQWPIEMEPLRLSELIENARSLAGPALTEKHIPLIINLQAQGTQLLGDRARLTQMLFSLLVNAVTATPRGSRIELVAAQSAPGAPPSVVLEIVDSGPGIPAAILDWAADGFRTAGPCGQPAGLGLVVASRIIQEHGGQLELANRVAGGSIARVVLPAAPGPLTGPLRAAPPLPAGRQPAGAGQTLDGQLSTAKKS